MTSYIRENTLFALAIHRASKVIPGPLGMALFINYAFLIIVMPYTHMCDLQPFTALYHNFVP